MAKRPLKILLLMVEPPLPFGGAVSRWYYLLLRTLVERGHHVTAFATCARPEWVEQTRALFPAPLYDLRVHAHPARPGVAAKLDTLRRPYSYMFSSEFRDAFAQELARGDHDIVQLESLWAGWLGLSDPDRCLLHIHQLYNIDLSETPPAGARARLQRALMFRAERRLLRAYPRILTASPRLRDTIHRFSPGAKVALQPLGLDVSLYPYITAPATEPTVSLIGSMNWHPTRSAALRLIRDLWPRIHAAVPAARLKIIGWHARSVLEPYLSTPGLSVEENVDDILPYFAQSSLLLYAPARGSGMKIKVMEAMALGVPVVTNAEGIEGIPARDGVHAALCEDNEGLVERTVALLREQSLRDKMRTAARALIEAHCGPHGAIDRLEAIYAENAR